MWIQNTVNLWVIYWLSDISYVFSLDLPMKITEGSSPFRVIPPKLYWGPTMYYTLWQMLRVHKWIIFISSFYRWVNWGSKKVRKCPMFVIIKSMFFILYIFSALPKLFPLSHHISSPCYRKKYGKIKWEEF